MRDGARLALAVAVIAFALRLPFLAAGYGWDSDAWRVAAAAAAMSETGTYAAPRLPGNPVHDITAALLWASGPAGRSPVAQNGATALVSALGAGAFALAWRRRGLPHALLAGVAMASLPAVFVASVSTLDYAWGFAFVAAALAAATHGRAMLTGAFAALAVGTRLPTAACLPGLALFLAAEMQGDPHRGSRLLRFTAIALVGGALPYLPLWLERGAGALAWYDHGYPPAWLGAKKLTQLLFKDYEKLTGGKWAYERDPVAIEHSRHLLAGVLMALLKAAPGQWTFRDVLLILKSRERLRQVLELIPETQGLTQYFARMHAGAIDGAAEQFFKGDETMAVVEVQAAEDLIGAVPQLGREEAPGVCRASQCRAGAQRRGVVAAGELQRRLHQCDTGGPQAGRGEAALPVCREQPAQPAVGRQQFARQLDSAGAAHAGAQQQREQFGVRQGGGAAFQEFFARPFAGGPVRAAAGRGAVEGCEGHGRSVARRWRRAQATK